MQDEDVGGVDSVKQEVELGRAGVDTPASFWHREEGDWHGPGGPAQPGKWPVAFLSLSF